MKLRAGLGKVGEACRSDPLTVGTFFSGSEMVQHVLQAIQAVCKAQFDLDLAFSFVWACEVDEWKRAFISAHTPPEHLLGDVIALSQSGWRGETDAKLTIELGTVDLLFAGFECDTVSSLNRFP
jgi:site-specific DNA-cytosine methylase